MDLFVLVLQVGTTEDQAFCAVRANKITIAESGTSPKDLSLVLTQPAGIAARRESSIRAS